jgi:hypothetical protein
MVLVLQAIQAAEEGAGPAVSEALTNAIRAAAASIRAVGPENLPDEQARLFFDEINTAVTHLVRLGRPAAARPLPAACLGIDERELSLARLKSTAGATDIADEFQAVAKAEAPS